MNDSVRIYYHNQMHDNYKIDERIIKSIINDNTNSINNEKLQIIIYYKNSKTHNLVMKNNMQPPTETLQKTNVVYQFYCPIPHCKAESYIGLCQTTLLRRLAMHGVGGSIFKHFTDKHNTKPTRDQLTANTSIIAQANTRKNLTIKEALLILEHQPTRNYQIGHLW